MGILRNSKSRYWLTALLITFVLLIGMSSCVYASEDMLEEVRYYLDYYYVDHVDSYVLNAPTIEETIKRLGDRNTSYMTAEEYRSFMNDLDRTLVGIGIEFESASQGALITKVFAGYSAEKAGLLVGDVITEVDGMSLSGLSNEEILSKLRGTEGSAVKLRISRGGVIFDFALQRMKIDLPQAEGSLFDNHIGYIGIYSFGDSVVEDFNHAVTDLRIQGADCWIIDLRYNPGGYTQAAQEMLGYFIGGNTAYYTQNREGYQEYLAVPQNYILSGPIIVLTNEYSASASEILTGALKDYGNVTIVGENTFGSGRVKALFSLSNGDFLKTSIDRFYSPKRNEIDGVGIKPDIDLKGTDELDAALLMLKNNSLSFNDTAAKSKIVDGNGFLHLENSGHEYILALADMRKADFWQSAMKILDSAGTTSAIEAGGENGWVKLTDDMLKNRQKILFPGYNEVGRLENIPLNKQFKVTFENYIDWNTLNNEKIELIDAGTGERINCGIVSNDASEFTVTPANLLKPKTEYWLVLHPGIKDIDGKEFKGGFAVALTAEK